jgi:elongation factor 1 alpha-like protein
MSRHQEFRSVQSTLGEHYYDDDDYDEEEEELSAEDQAAMRQGVADVKAALGVEASKVTTKQIEEALYYYYYDVDKTVTYLMTKFIAPPPSKAAKPSQKAKPPGKHISCLLSKGAPRHLPGTSSADTVIMPSRNCGHLPVWNTRLKTSGITGSSSLTYGQGHESMHPYPSIENPHIGTTSSKPAMTRSSISAIFDHMPWGNVPLHRLTVFIEPERPRGGLLGGSGAAPKLTRMQQLAAARKKKVADKKPFGSEDTVDTTRQGIQELSVEDHRPTEKENQVLDVSSGFGKRQKLSETQAAGRMPLEAVCREANRQDSFTSQHNVMLQPAEQDPTPPDDPAPELAPPSVFAQTLFGVGSHEPAPVTTRQFALPYMAYCPSLTDAFSKPSPDDVVLTAQAKGSIAGKGKN